MTMFVDLISCYMLVHRTREALACASEMCKKIHTCRSLTVSNSCVFSYQLTSRLMSLQLLFSLTFFVIIIFNVLSLQCFDSVGWVTGRASGL